MAARMDLEARLRALRAPTQTQASALRSAPAPQHTVIAPESLPVAPVADVTAWPEPPVAWPEPPTAKPRRASTARVPEAAGDAMVLLPRRSSVVSQSSSSRKFQPPVPAQPTPTAPTPSPPQPTTATAAAPAPASGISVASLLGPAYTEAIQIAQYAIENERNRNVHTAIDAYIRAGQALIAIGRQQHMAHLQTIVKKKALALLERAEGLSDWVSTVMATHGTSDAATVDAEFAASQHAQEQALDAKEALVAKMKAENSDMAQKLNQLVLLTKVRARFRRVLSERRARKAEEALRRASLNDDDAENDSHSGNTNDVEGDSAESDSDGVDKQTQQRAGQSTVSATLVKSPSLEQREAQKRDLVNELHARIGLPEISALRKFTPLSADATKDLRHVELEDELEAARLEAERLRAAVQEMEACFQATLAQTRQQSLKLTQAKDADLAQMENELQRVRSELERERRLTASSFGGSSRSTRSGASGDDDDDPDAFEDVAMIRSLRSSLHAIEHPEDLVTERNNAGETTGGPSKQEPALSRGWSQSESEDDSDTDEDGGVWL